MVRTMMRRMCIEALYRRPNTSKAAPGQKIYPYLLRGLAIDRPNQVWAMDITYIPMARGFVYLAAVVDWFTRRVLAWRLSITMEADFCCDAVEEALARHGRLEIFNTDQGAQFTSAAFTGLLLDNRIVISMETAVPGGTTSSSSGCGGRSNTRRSTCGPTTAWTRHARRSAGIWFSITRYVPIRALTRERRIKPTSTIRRSERQHEIRRRMGSSLRSGYARPAQRPLGTRRNQPAGDPLIEGETLSRLGHPPLTAASLPSLRGHLSRRLTGGGFAAFSTNERCGAATGVFGAFGFFGSRLLRCRSLAMSGSYIYNILSRNSLRALLIAKWRLHLHADQRVECRVSARPERTISYSGSGTPVAIRRRSP
jgi:putative transposase